MNTRLAIAPAGDEAIKSFVELVTNLMLRLKTPLVPPRSRGPSTHSSKAARTIHLIFWRVFSAIEALPTGCLKDHPKLKAERLQIYQTLCTPNWRFIHQQTEHFNADSLQEAHNKLVNLLKTNAEEHPSDRSSSPEGILKEMQESFTKAATTKSHIQLDKYSREEINAKLKATNRPDVPDATHRRADF
ncbi:hypothetical protein PSHT_09681 [Puccinia striiformis]|uniref:Uncharacterized protein n=1 Tax=Puccinia striiformis TaxID=27350 RepID=A0A2S4VFB3_9BASI|nr:hypothetical protein PSHT_09681 [Puccinia striiformis]